jgi:hypothetical protein
VGPTNTTAGLGDVLGRRPMSTVKIGGKDIELRECPECHREVISLIREFRDGKVVRTFCHLCHEDPDSPMATVARKIHDYAVAGTLDQYPLAERLADLNGENYIKPN